MSLNVFEIYLSWMTPYALRTKIWPFILDFAILEADTATVIERHTYFYKILNSIAQLNSVNHSQSSLQLNYIIVYMIAIYCWQARAQVPVQRLIKFILIIKLHDWSKSVFAKITLFTAFSIICNTNFHYLHLRDPFHG